MILSMMGKDEKESLIQAEDQCVSLDETLSKCRHDPQRQRAM